jgi:TIR domain-containing protein
MAPPYVFVGHASDDRRRLRPLIEALALQGLSVWIDRPGPAGRHFEFEPLFIARYGIRSLRLSEGWSDQISETIRAAGAVLVCLSRAVAEERRVSQELLLGLHHKKLVACVIDDLYFDSLPGALGLPDGSRLELERVDLRALERAVALERHQPGGSAAADGSARQQWQAVERLTRQIERLFDAAGGRPPTAAQMAAAREAIAGVPVAPMVSVSGIPDEVVAAFAARLTDPGRAARFLTLAAELRLSCNPEGYTERQITVRAGEVLSPRALTPELFWRAVLNLSGMKSRRTVAALLMAPGAPQRDTLPTAAARVFADLVDSLSDVRNTASREACLR